MAYTVQIAPDGKINIKDVTVYGASCQEVTKKLEELLGASDESKRTLTEEYYEAQPTELEQEGG
jgi:hypothetical protein